MAFQPHFPLLASGSLADVTDKHEGIALLLHVGSRLSYSRDGVCPIHLATWTAGRQIDFLWNRQDGMGGIAHVHLTCRYRIDRCTHGRE